jgi:hydrogenase-4 component F
MVTLVLLLPLVPLAAALLSVAIASRTIARAVTALSGVTTFAAAVALVVLHPDRVEALRGLVAVDALSLVLVLMVGVVYATAAVYSVGYIHPTPSRLHDGGYFLLFNLAGFVLFAASTTGNIAVLWVAIELSTIFTAILVAHDAVETALEAAWKFILLASAGLAVAFVGVALFYFAGTAPLGRDFNPTWTRLMAAAPQLSPGVVRLALVLTVIGFGSKAGLAPFHTWLPDAHGEAPSPISAMLSGAVIGVALYVILRFYLIAIHAIGPAFPHALLLGFGIASLLLAALFVLRQRNFKRLLAYSSIEHMGLIAAGIGLNSPLAVYGALLHFITHGSTKSMAFYGAGGALRTYDSREIDRVRGFLAVAPITAGLFLVSILAIVGLPPFGVFRSEFMILAGGFGARNFVAVAVLIVLVNLAFLGILGAVDGMVFGPPPDAVPGRKPSAWLWAPMLLNLAFVLGLGLVIPGPLGDVLTRAGGLFAVGAHVP